MRLLLGIIKFLLPVALATSAVAEWRVALPGWKYEFPRDHRSHPEFKTEWWYFTGNLAATDGREFGYQLTFFRQGVSTDGGDFIPLSRFVVRDVKFAHFTVSDLSKGKFRFFQKQTRGAYGEAGFDKGSALAWLDDWSCELTGDNAFRLRAKDGDVSLDLVLRSTKSPVIHGTNGVSQKSSGEGRASHYYSLTRLQTEGTLLIGAEEVPVTGQSWFDHEWATNQLAENQVGWDWFSLQFKDGSELMLFQLRKKDGSADAYSAGTFIDPKGGVTAISQSGFTLTPGQTWKSPQTGGLYPTTWQITVPSLDLDLTVQAAANDQELRLKPIIYWEGAIRTEGKIRGQKAQGSGYLEMTGYASPVVGMQPQH